MIHDDRQILAEFLYSSIYEFKTAPLSRQVGAGALEPESIIGSEYGWCFPDQGIRDPGERLDKARNPHSGVHQTLEGIDDLPLSDNHDADLGHPVTDIGR